MLFDASLFPPSLPFLLSPSVSAPCEEAEAVQAAHPTQLLLHPSCLCCQDPTPALPGQQKSRGEACSSIWAGSGNDKTHGNPELGGRSSDLNSP